MLTAGAVVAGNSFLLPLAGLIDVAGGWTASDMTAVEALLDEWADIALRTLVWCKRDLPDYQKWADRYHRATSNPNEVGKLKAGQPNAIEALQVEVEGRMELQGATAIEDKLQDGVPELLADLREAGVKVWMLTGDKVGTAMNIARACNILTADTQVLK